MKSDIFIKFSTVPQEPPYYKINIFNTTIIFIKIKGDIIQMEENTFTFPGRWYKALNNFVEADAITIEEKDRILSLLLSEGLDINEIETKEFTNIEYVLAYLLVQERAVPDT